jgi:lipopolysaccharide transport system ATP-binding protein
MNSESIQVDHLSKRFQLGEGRRGTNNVREAITNGIGSLIRKMRDVAAGEPKKSSPTELWALKDVSFSVARGEAVGIIGRNGAGKSTLLKILSRITPPTSGEVLLNGRVGSLLEVGTGFHPELTGRENVFLNGAIIGMSRREVAKKFEDIVDFSEIRDFIDTPVKRYSSGMYVRLAFAVAAHLEPDILLLDEVLAVGDLAFQRKCMEHAKRLGKRGVTLLLVSHNMFAIKSMCPRAVYLAKGQVVVDGPTELVTRHYEEDSRLQMTAWAEATVGNDPEKCPIRFLDMEILDMEGDTTALVNHGQQMKIRLHYRANRPMVEPNFTVTLVRGSDEVSCCCYTTATDGFSTGVVEGDGTIELTTPPLKLVADSYTVYMLAWDKTFEKLYCSQAGKSFHVADPLLNTEFGVFHEAGHWTMPTDRKSESPAPPANGGGSKKLTISNV